MKKSLLDTSPVNEQDTLRILVIEDDEDDFILAEDYLEEAYGKKAKVTWASTYNDAVNLIDNNSYDVYLIDYMLGEHTGIELTKEITSSTYQVYAVILLTGMDNREVDIEATNAGAMDYLVKQELNAALLERSIRYALKRKHIEEKLVSLAQHDPLTGLANRTKFNLALNEKIEQAKRKNNSFAVILLDLDNFKEVNDTLGHSTGDTLLKITAKRINFSTRNIDIIARLGGDEFAIIAEFENIGEGSSRFAERILEELSKPLELDYQHVNTGASIGIAVYPHDGVTPESLLKNSDLAMYKSKRSGRNTYRFYDPEFELELTQSKKLHDELQVAIDDNQFILMYQPIVDTQRNKVVKAEALIRWQHPEKGLLSPVYFIEAAERNAKIIQIGQWVMQQAFKDCLEWQKQEELKDVGVAVNLSPHQFCSEHLIDDIKNALNNLNLHHRSITLEITETTLMEIGEDMIERLNLLDDLGVNLAIDDFGTGYSSLAYLKRFPVSTLKIDRSFVSDIEHDSDDNIITKTIVNLGQSLNKKVIAEGIETKHQLDIVNAFGCHLIQGYHFAKPMPVNELLIWVKQFSSQGG
ncbi:two-component system response regulator [Pleionea sediminis]|uniref:two-component system response regulator n=1 Tax=Pleionea sediminis TaxID=2569479 RepID=UPI0011868F14|nr:EAL domain-containing protein [Pleionea sediminis]